MIHLKIISAKKQKGQALPVGIAAILFITLLGLLVFNTSQTTSEKMRLSNTADAAAYSGMVWQARALNFQGYTNRAMVANQVSIAQIVSFVSWTRYLKTAARNLNNTLGLFPPARIYTQTFYNIANQVNNIAANFGEGAISGLNILLEVLSGSQTTVHYASIAATTDIVLAVVNQNDPSYRVTPVVGIGALANNANDWRNFSRQYSDNKRLNRKANIITASRDGWARDRGWDFTIININAGVFSYKVELVKAGETRLLSDGDMNSEDDSDAEFEWKGKDTFSIHTAITCYKRWRRRTCRNEIPVGWGSAYASSTSSDIDNSNDCSGWFCRQNAWSRNRRAERLAEREKDELDGYDGGVQPYRELSDIDPDSENSKDPRLALAIEVMKPGGARTSSEIDGLGSPTDAVEGQSRNGIQTGMFSMPDKYADGDIRALSKAEVYFRRPDQFVMVEGQRRTEYGNLFNPYWDVHLIDPKTERIIAWGVSGGMF